MRNMECAIDLELPLAQINNMHCVYYHYDTTNRIYYVGVAKLTEVYKFADAKDNTAWLEYAKQQPIIRARICFMSLHEMECHNKRYTMIRELSPYCNLNGRPLARARSQIICNETNETFNTIQEIIAIHGGHVSQYSAHLRGVPGYKTVRNKTYRRVLG